MIKIVERMVVSREWNANIVREVIKNRNIRFKNKEELTDAQCLAVLEKVHQDLPELIEKNYVCDEKSVAIDLIIFWIQALYLQKITKETLSRLR